MENPPTLKEVYKVGDGVIGTIVAVQSGSGNKRKRLELSLIPVQVNADLSLEDLECGMLLPGEIKSVEDKGYVVDLGLQKGAVGFMAFGSQSQDKLAIGSVIHCSVTGKNKTVVTLEMADGGKVNKATGLLKNYNSLRPGTLVENVEIKAIHEGLLNVSINEMHTGQIDIFNLPVPSTLTNPKTHIAGINNNYAVGMRIPSARIVFADCHVGADEKFIILSALPSVLSSDKVRREIEAISDDSIAVGTKFEDAKIVRVDPGLGVVLSLDSSEGNEQFAQVHISRLSDEKITKISAPYRVNSVHACRIIDYDPFAAIAIASMAQSTLEQQFLSIESIPVGSVVRGEVTAITPGLGILVNLSERIRALCPINQLTETQSQDALKSYRLGQKFKFRVLSTDAAARRVMLTRKKGLLEGSSEALCDYKDAVVGEFYDGYVASIRPFGCIVRFFGDVKAILPLSELTEETFVKEAKEVVFEGQVVRCRVIRVDREAKSMAVSLRKTDNVKNLSKRKATETTETTETAESKKEAKKDAKKLKKSESSETAESSCAISPPVTPKKVTESKEPKLTETTKVTEPVVKAVLPSLRQLEEEELAKEEMLMSVSTSEAVKLAPVNAEDLLSMKEMCEEFERRLLGSPNSSMLWIQYMSVLIKSMELDAARSLAQRALQTISIRAESEKLNIWIALMNLEHAYGTEASLKATFERACVYNDSKAVHLALAKIYEESAKAEQPETIKTVEDFYANNLMKKYRQSCKVWVNLAQFLFTVKKDNAGARKLLSQALQALPRRKHMKVTLKFAQMEFRHGSLERGRTLFEGLIASSPSRLDIWSQFCDQEERHLPATTENLRHLYTRIVHLKLSSKKAKFFFKKFLEFEKQYGDQLTIQQVKDLAQKYVESTMSKSNDD